MQSRPYLSLSASPGDVFFLTFACDRLPSGCPRGTVKAGNTMRRIFDVVLAAGAAALLFAAPVWAASDPGQLIKSVTAEVTDICNTRTGANRAAAVREVLRTKFDWQYIGRSTLGGHWNAASEQQRARFLAALETEETRAYSERLTKLADYNLTVDKVVARASGVWAVDSSLSQPGGPPIKLEWEVRDAGHGPRIADVKVAGISLFLTKRSEFNAYIQNSGGSIEPLIQELEVRAARSTRRSP
jgi:phospholipid transport system substrate-binding protein